MFFKVKAKFVIFFLCFTTQIVSGQNQKLADSLITEYKSGKYLVDEATILSNIAINEKNPDLKLEYSDLLIKKVSSDSLFNFLHTGYLQKGNALVYKGNYTKALESYFQSLNYAKRNNDEIGIGALNISIADAYSIIGNSSSAAIYYDKGIQLLRKINDSSRLAKALLNMGDEFFNNKEYESAKISYDESAQIFNDMNNSQGALGAAYNFGNMGMVYAMQGEDELAKSNLLEAIKAMEEQREYTAITVYLIYLSDIALKQEEFNSALTYAKRSLALAQEYGLKKEISDASLQLSEIYEIIGNSTKSFNYFKNYIVYRDSVNNIEKVREMGNLQTNFEVAQKQTEVDLLHKESEIQLLKDKRQKIIIYATVLALVLIFVLLFFLYRRYSFVKETNTIIEGEKNRSDALLLNILPKETAQELKETGQVEAKKFESVTVLFTDFKDFTRSSADLTPESLVRSVDYYFSKFDEVMEKHGLEKIKTMGDSYMCTGGIHLNKEDHAIRMVHAAFEIARITEKVKIKNKDNIMPYEIRIGINTGPVVAGVVGTQKFAYDIWGDTVNVAARMETNSETGRINISENTYELIKDEFECE
ncbi:adenylate/guanylate cyclase domain-containing protein, partial [Eudoraea sp.]|uniref:adenylate/guanylate cyclase domain-containing protein n=1 Tax=Eudoraea sp. TaxID=1979955 RepID=UPI003C70FB24